MTINPLHRLTYGVELEALAWTDEPLGMRVREHGIEIQRRRESAIRAFAADLSARSGLPVATTDGDWRVAFEYVDGTDHQIGIEVVSPVLRHGQESQVSAICRGLQALGSEVNSTCGLHVHVGGLTPAEVLALVGLVYEYEECIYALAGGGRRESSECRPLTQYRVARFLDIKSPSMKAIMQRALELDADELRHEGPASKLTMPRKYGLNLCALRLHGTVEFRYFPGTTDPDLALAFVALVRYACVAAVERGWRLEAPRTARDVRHFLKTIKLPSSYADTLLPPSKARALALGRRLLSSTQEREAALLWATSAEAPVGDLGNTIASLVPPAVAAAASRLTFPIAVLSDFGDT